MGRTMGYDYISLEDDDHGMVAFLRHSVHVGVCAGNPTLKPEPRSSWASDVSGDVGELGGWAGPEVIFMSGQGGSRTSMPSEGRE